MIRGEVERVRAIMLLIRMDDQNGCSGSCNSFKVPLASNSFSACDGSFWYTQQQQQQQKLLYAINILVKSYLRFVEITFQQWNHSYSILDNSLVTMRQKSVKLLLYNTEHMASSEAATVGSGIPKRWWTGTISKMSLFTAVSFCFLSSFMWVFMSSNS